MIEETAQISFQFADDGTSHKGNGDLLDISNDNANACVAVAVQVNNVISRINSSSMMSNNQEDLGLEIQDCSAALKLTSSSTAVRVDEKRLRINRAVLLLSSSIGFILLVGFVSLGLIIWNKNQTTMRNPAHSPSELHKGPLSKPVPDAFCHNRSTVGFLSDLFTTGYDIMRVNPLHKKVYGRQLLEHTFLQECRILPETHRCQPSVESIVIDNLFAYQQWFSRYVTFSSIKTGELDDSVLIGAVSSAQDNDLQSIQAALMSGNLIVMTHMKCPLVNASRIHAPHIKPEYAQRLRLNTKADEEEEMLELVEDFGAHFVEQVILGTEVVIRFTLDRKTVDYFKRKNVSFVSQATASGLYILSRSDVSIDISKTNQKLAKDFVAAAQMQVYSGTALSAPLSDFQTADHWVRSALKHFGVISLRLKLIEDLFTELFQTNATKIQEKWQLSRQRLCYQILSLGLNGKCTNANSNSSKSLQRQMQQRTKYPENELPTVFVLPLLLVWTNRSTVCLRASWNHCLELCRNDPLCSAATICLNSNSAIYQLKETKTISSCPSEFQGCDCALHRQQDFSHGIVSPGAMTLVPARQDLRPVTLRGFAVYGQPLFSVNRVTDLASCARLCSRTATCQIASFSHYDLGQHKVCKLFSNMTGNELRRKGRAITVFMMATFIPCFSGEVEAGRSNCPTNTNCSSFYGMCVCIPGYFKDGSTCLSRSLGYQEKVDGDLLEAPPENSVGVNGHFSRKHQESVKLHTDHHQVSSFPSKFSIQEASIWSNEHQLEEDNFTSSALPTLAHASITSSTTVIMPIETTGPNSSEISTTTSKQDLASNTESPTTGSINAATHSESSKETTKFSSMHSKSSYVPWQMRSWNRATIA